MALIAGVDDAGRGPVIGPLVIAGVLFQESAIPRLSPLGVKDSKLLTPKKRGSLEPDILSIALRYKVIQLSPAEVDDYVLNGEKLRKLNWLEAKTMAQIVSDLHPDTVYVDASDVNAARYGDQIRELVPFQVQVVSAHQLDRDNPVVAAASIIAKVNRDRAVEGLRQIYGDFGSGYPSDPRTIRFVTSCVRRGILPDCVRKSWKTLERVG